MKTIKYLFYSLFGLITIVNLTSCSEDYLEVLPPEIIAEDYWTTTENAEMAVVGCYDVLGWDGNHNSIPTFFGDIIGRDGHKGGDVGGDQEWMDTYINFTYDNTKTMIDNAWTDYYVGIGRCNAVIENVPKMDIVTQEDKDRMLAEAYFIRGYFYFELVKTFGEVPLVDHVLVPSEYNQTKASFADLYTFIQTDFINAAKYLPEKSELSPTQYGRATKGAANAYLAKAYIYNKEWNKAFEITNTIINSGEYSLMSNFEDVFKLENEHNSELVFEIEYVESGSGDFGNENEGSMFGVYMTTRNHPYSGIGGWGFNCPTQNLYDEFETGDIRREATVIENGETLWIGTSDEVTFNTNFPTNIDHFSNQKYALPASQQAIEFSDSPKNWITIRYADVLLWNAEAAAQAGGDWQTPLNEVRLRANLLPTTESDALKAIYHERRVELAMEGHRFWDIVRQGRGEELYGEFGFIEGVHNHLPIPQNQLDLNGGTY